MYTPDSLLIGDPNWNAYRVIEWADAIARHGVPPVHAHDIAQVYMQETDAVRLNLDLVIAQAIHETGWFSSARWHGQRNPAGIGITSNDAPGLNYRYITTGVRAHLAHLCCYCFHEYECPVCNHLHWFDPRHDFHDGIRQVAGLVRPTRKWASPGDNYVNAIIKIANSVAFPGSVG